MDQGVVEFVRLCELEKVCLTGEMIMERAKEIANELRVPQARHPRFGWPWLRHLNARYGVRWKRVHGESDSVNLKVVEPRLQQLRYVIHLYKPRDVYNMDESAFFYNRVSRGSLVFNTTPALI